MPNDKIVIPVSDEEIGCNDIVPKLDPKNTENKNKEIVIPFPRENRVQNSDDKNCIFDIIYIILYLCKYVSIFFALSFVGKIGAKFIYWCNETNHWKYPDGWDWEDINAAIFLQAIVGFIIVCILIGCWVKN